MTVGPRGSPKLHCFLSTPSASWGKLIDVMEALWLSVILDFN